MGLKNMYKAHHLFSQKSTFEVRKYLRFKNQSRVGLQYPLLRIRISKAMTHKTFQRGKWPSKNLKVVPYRSCLLNSKDSNIFKETIPQQLYQDPRVMAFSQIHLQAQLLSNGINYTRHKKQLERNHNSLNETKGQMKWAF